MTQQPFFILSYPRSRTAWLAHALSSGAVRCHYEASTGCVSLNDLAAKLNATAAEYAGNSDSANALMLDQILERWPGARLVVITRDTDTVANSLRRLNIPVPDDAIKLILARTRAGIERALRLGALSVPFERVGDAEYGHRIWDQCAPGQPFDMERWQNMNRFNIQIRHDIALATYHANQEQFEKLGEAVT